MTRVGAWRLGVADGFRQPHDLTCGVSWPTYDDPRNEAYDRGANLGQLAGRIVESIAFPLRTARRTLSRYLP